MVDQNTKLLLEIREIVNGHSKMLNEHSDDIKSLKRSLLLIEDAVTNKIPALFDAYSANQEKHDEFNARITKVENISDQNSIKISILEDKAKEHSRKLAKLSS